MPDERNWLTDGPWCENSTSNPCPNRDPKPCEMPGDAFSVIWLCDEHRGDLRLSDIDDVIRYRREMVNREQLLLAEAREMLVWYQAWMGQNGGPLRIARMEQERQGPPA